MSVEDSGRDSLEALREILRAQPDRVDAHGRLGGLLLERAREVQMAALARRRRADAAARALYEEALEHFRAIQRMDPASAPAFRLCAIALRELGDLAGACEQFARAARLAPDDAVVASDYAAALSAAGNAQRARQVLEQAVAAHPDDPGLHGELALVLLGEGAFERGWEEYEWRLRLPDATTARTVSLPRWRGESLAGRTLLVTSEQGIGDEVMFASCFPDLLAQAGRCIFEVSTRLVPVFARSFPAARIVTRSIERGVAAEACAEADCWTPAGSVPRYLRTRWDDFPQAPGYLKADSDRVRHWAARLDALGSGLKVGLAWSGGLPSTLRAARSIALEALRPLFLPGISFVALEFTDCTEEVAVFNANASGCEQLSWWPEAVQTLDETAAIASALDLVLSVPTATAHLAAALGRPTWVMVAGAPTWRYLWQGERMPWYGSMRVLRCAPAEAPQGVVARAREALAGLTRSAGPRPD
jgi:Tetratricopeptide repeat